MKKLSYLLICLFIYCETNAQVCFDPAVTYGSGDTAFAICKGDFNGDSKIDLATANYYSNSISVVMGDGLGIFGSPTNYPTNSINPIQICSADFNNDGFSDIATANRSNIGNISLFIADGLGSFANAVTITVANQSNGITSGDFNNDLKQDIALTTVDSGVWVLTGNGDGTFLTPTQIYQYYGLEFITTAHINNDNYLDIVVTDYITESMGVFLGNGMGGFNTIQEYLAGGPPFPQYPRFVCLAEVNGDGNTDAIIANRDGGNISILLGDGAGGFGWPVMKSVPAGPWEIAACDFNSDGKLDIAVTNALANNVSILTGDGAGNFSPLINYYAGPRTFFLAVADFNGDSLVDIASSIGTYNNDNIAVFLNCTTIGIKEMFEDNNISIYPNPTSEKIHIQQIDKNIKIEELLLIDVYGIKHKAMMNEKNEIDVRQLPSGIYFLTIGLDNKIIVKKIVIQH